MYFNNSPLQQFEIKNLLSINILQNNNLSITNIGLYLSLSSLIVIILFTIGNNYGRVVSNRNSLVLETVYSTLHSIVTNQINEHKGQIFFPFMFTLFVFILINNLVGMVPYSFASTSHFILTFALSFTIVIGATILGL